MKNDGSGGPYRPIRWPFRLFVGLTVLAVLFVILVDILRERGLSA